MGQYKKIICLSLALILGLSACVRSISQPTPNGSIPQADGLFVDFYSSLGGMEVLGPIISPVFSEGKVSYQYAENGLMVYDSGDGSNGRYYLEAIGTELGVADPPANPSVRPNDAFISGHNIYPGFMEIFDSLGGESVVGAPLTEAKYNPDKNRIEQYFENLGFFLDVGKLEEEVRLLAYGSWMCKQDCRSTPAQNAVIELPDITIEILPEIEVPLTYYFLPMVTRDTALSPALFQAVQSNKVHMPVVLNLFPIKPLFDELVTRLGVDLTGFALSGIYENQAGQLEQVFENAVLRLDPADDSSVQLLSLPGLVNIPPDVPEQPGTRAGMIFYPLTDGQGFFIPEHFIHYMNLHGGDTLFGKPVTRYQPLNDQVTWQCFENLCLEEHQNTINGLLIRPSALGYQYRNMVDTAKLPSVQSDDQFDQLSIQFWEKFPRLSSEQPQSFDVIVLKNYFPVGGADLILSLNIPNQNLMSFQFPPTDENGETHLEIEPISVDVGTLIPYQICLLSELSNTVCVKDSFMVWDNQ